MAIAPNQISDRDKKVERTLIITLALNWGVSFAKIGLGFFTNTLSVMADGFHSLFDGVSNVAGIVGLRVASKPADKEHPYGHRKIEPFVSFFISLLLFLTSFTILTGIFERFNNPVKPEVSPLIFIIMAGSLVINLFVSDYEKRKAKELNSEILAADSLHTRTDVFISCSVIAGLIGTALGLIFLDQVVAFVIVVLIAKAAWRIMFSSVNTLIDAAPIEDSKIRLVAEKVKGVKNVHAIRCRGDKSCAFIELHIQVKAEMTIKQGHDLSEDVKNKIMHSIEGVVDVLVHIEPESDSIEDD